MCWPQAQSASSWCAPSATPPIPAPRRRPCARRSTRRPRVAQRAKRQKRKRKQRAARPSGGEAMATGYSRARAKDDEARAALVPLEPGERPTAVTVGAVVALLFALANLASYAAGLKVRGDRPAISGIVVYSGLMLLMAYGMWRSKYWAVLGMEALLALLIIIFALVALTAGSVLSLVISVVAVGAAGTLFWFLIKAMARIQMPQRPGAQKG